MSEQDGKGKETVSGSSFLPQMTAFPWTPPPPAHVAQSMHFLAGFPQTSDVVGANKCYNLKRDTIGSCILGAGVFVP